MRLIFYESLSDRVYHEIEDAPQAPSPGDRVTFKFTTEDETWNVTSVQWNYGPTILMGVAVYISGKRWGKI